MFEKPRNSPTHLKIPFDLDKLGYRQHCEAAFFGIQVGCYFALTLIEQKIRDTPENSAAPRVHTPPEIVMGNEAKPAKDQTVKEYDLDKFKELRTQQLMVEQVLKRVAKGFRISPEMCI